MRRVPCEAGLRDGSWRRETPWLPFPPHRIVSATGIPTSEPQRTCGRIRCTGRLPSRSRSTESTDGRAVRWSSASLLGSAPHPRTITPSPIFLEPVIWVSRPDLPCLDKEATEVGALGCLALPAIWCLRVTAHWSGCDGDLHGRRRKARSSASVPISAAHRAIFPWPQAVSQPSGLLPAVRRP